MLLKGQAGTVQEVYKLSVNAVFINLSCRMSLPFPATFVRSSLLKAQGFDASYRICGDYDFVLRNAAYGNIAKIPACVTYMETGGLSDNPAYASLHEQEHERVLSRNALPRARTLIEACVRSRQETDSEFS